MTKTRTNSQKKASKPQPRAFRPGGAQREPECGSATLSAVALMSLVMLLAALAVVIGQFANQRAAANSAADLAALAAADRWSDGEGMACDVARRVAHRNEARLTSCAVAGADVSVSVSVTVPRSIRIIARAAGDRAPELGAFARAGPQGLS